MTTPTDAREVRVTMRLGMAFLAICCLVLGLVPAIALRLLRPVTMALTGVVAEPHFRVLPDVHHDPAQAQHGTYAPLAILVLLVLAGWGGLPARPARSAGGCAAGSHRRGSAARGSNRRCSTPPPRLTKAVRIIFRSVVRPVRAVEITYAQEPYFVATVGYEGRVQPIYERYLYRPAVRVLIRAAEQVRRLQNGRLRRYLAYQFAVLVIVLLLTR